MRFLGLDVGTKTIGLAICDDENSVATPLHTITRQGGSHDLEAVATACAEHEATALVIGLPLDLNGEVGDAARRVKTLGARLAEHLACPVHYWDERFSTVAAERALLEGKVRRNKRKQVINHVAAALILQCFIDHQRMHAREAAP